MKDFIVRGLILSSNGIIVRYPPFTIVAETKKAAQHRLRELIQEQGYHVVKLGL